MSGITTDLNYHDELNVGTGMDGIVVVSVLEAIPGGRTLDVTGYAPVSIQEGHIVIEKTDNGDLKPMPVSGSAYAALPSGHTYKGHVISTTLTSKPMVGIMTRGTLNYMAAPYDMSSILAAVRTARPLINYMKD
jgi:hypothetical protein